MGIGRAEFLKQASLAFVGLAIDPLEAVAINENILTSPK